MLFYDNAYFVLLNPSQLILINNAVSVMVWVSVSFHNNCASVIITSA